MSGYAVKSDGSFRAVDSESECGEGETFQENAPELSSSTTPKSVTRRQAKIAMLRAGILDQVEAAIAASSRENQITWAEATDFRRDFPLLNQMAAALNISSQEIDNLFLLASTIV